MLANLVRLRYRDPPHFLEVSSVSTQYVFGGSADAGMFSIGNSGSSGGADTGVVYEERPTITYVPLQGEQFADRLLSPVDMETLILLSISGWRTDRLMRCCVQRVNDLWNAPTASGPTPELAPEYEDFLEMAETLERLNKAGQGQVRFKVADNAGNGERAKVKLHIVFHEDAESAADLRRLRSLLNLDPGRSEYRLTGNPTLRQSDDIAIFPRSVLAAMSYLSQAVEPPQRDIDAGRVTVTRREDGSVFEWSELAAGLFRVRSSLDPPSNSFVRVHYRDAWFYIDDSDLSSKATFNLLEQLFQLQAGEAGGRAPLLTLPVGG